MIQDSLQEFWKRFMNDFASRNSVAAKWFKDNQPLKVGQLVIVTSNKTEKGKWPLGRIEKLFPSKVDGVVRSVQVRIAYKSYRRSVHCLVPLFGDEDDAEGAEPEDPRHHQPEAPEGPAEEEGEAIDFLRADPSRLV